jgi:hypothetical protein
MPRCSAAGLDFRIIPAGFNAPLEFLTGFTPTPAPAFAEGNLSPGRRGVGVQNGLVYLKCHSCGSRNPVFS